MPALPYQDGKCPLHIAGERAGSAAVTGWGARQRGQRKKVPVMAEVACFCGCLFSFDGGAGACPRCGEVASVTVGPAPGAGRHGPETAVLVMNRTGQNGHTPEACPAPAEASVPAGIAIATLTRRPRTGGERRRQP